MRILVFGNAGSGKTTLARRFGDELGLTVLDLDNVAWSPTEDGVFRLDSEIAAELAASVSANPAWVIEGCYGRWMEHLLPHGTEIIFLNPNVEVCLANRHARRWEPTNSRPGKSRINGCPPCSIGCAPTTLARMTYLSPRTDSSLTRSRG